MEKNEKKIYCWKKTFFFQTQQTYP
jgi:hypothetical protein